MTGGCRASVEAGISHVRCRNESEMKGIQKIRLKIPEWEDMEYIRWLWGDAETMAPVGGTVELSNDQAKTWFERMVSPGSPTDCFRLVCDANNRPVGEISFHRMNLESLSAEFNLKIASPERGKGYAAQALSLFLDYFFNDLGGREMIDDIALDNKRGQQVLLDFGFVHDPSIEGSYRLRLTKECFEELYRP